MSLASGRRELIDGNSMDVRAVSPVAFPAVCLQSHQLKQRWQYSADVGKRRG